MEAPPLPLAILSSAFRRLPQSVGGFFRRPDTASGAVLNLRVPLPLLFSSRFRRNGGAPIGRLLHGICRFKRVDAIPFRFLVGFLTKFIQFAPKADANSNSAKRKLEQKRIFSLQNLVETKTCCTFAIANGTGSGKTEI